MRLADSSRLGVIGLVLIASLAGAWAATLYTRRTADAAARRDAVVGALVVAGQVSDSLHGQRVQQETLLVYVSDTVTRTRVAYRTLRDSFPVYPTTSADTARALEQLPTLIARADAAVAAAERLQARADSVRRLAVAESDTLRSERDGWKRLALTPRSRFGGAAIGLYDPVARIPGVASEVHVRVTGPWELGVRAEARLRQDDARVSVELRRTF